MELYPYQDTIIYFAVFEEGVSYLGYNGYSYCDDTFCDFALFPDVGIDDYRNYYSDEARDEKPSVFDEFQEKDLQDYLQGKEDSKYYQIIKTILKGFVPIAFIKVDDWLDITSGESPKACKIIMKDKIVKMIEKEEENYELNENDKQIIDRIMAKDSDTVF